MDGQQACRGYDTMASTTDDVTSHPLPAACSQDWDARPPTVHGAFERWCASTPDAPALVCGGQSLTYAELDRRANQFARFLHGRGVTAGSLVALLLDRSVDAVVALLGTLKAGAAYVPLDPRAPASQIERVLDGVCPRFVVVDGQDPGPGTPRFPTAGLDAVAGEVARQSPSPPRGTDRPESLAYVMYTSGSTGRPKGVKVPHRAVVGLVVDNPFIDFGPLETFLCLAPLGFDASTFEIWGALLNGGKLAIVPDAAPSLAGISEAIAAYGVTTLWLTAGLFHLMVDGELAALRPLRQLIAGGDVLSPPHVGHALRGLPGCRLFNGYGPTENTTFTCCHAITPADVAAEGGIPIGLPIARTEVHVFDEAMRPVPDGFVGQLYVGGEGLSDGYLDMPGPTAASFVPHPYDATPGARLYRTGDLASRRPDGALVFAGRADRQVKVNGHRVELDAVELAIRALPGVADAAVVAHTHGAAGVRIDGFLILSARSAAAEAAVRAGMREAMPAAMIPSFLVVLDRFPLTPSGKVDRRALSDAATRSDLPPSTMPPAGEVEQVLAAAWSAALGLPVIDVDVNFFDLGGTSLELLRVHAEVSRRFGARIGMVEMFRFPTVRALSRFIRDGNAPGGTAPSAATGAPDRSAAHRRRMRDARAGGAA